MDYRIIENTNDKHLQEVKDILKASDDRNGMKYYKLFFEDER